MFTFSLNHKKSPVRKLVVFNPSITGISMPRSMSISEWTNFFKYLMGADYGAAFHTVLAYFVFLCDITLETPPSFYAGFYYDLAIEMAADDRYPANEAAAQSGFFDEGLRAIVRAARVGDDYFETYLAVIREIIIDTKIPAPLYKEICDILDEVDSR